MGYVDSLDYHEIIFEYDNDANLIKKSHYLLDVGGLYRTEDFKYIDGVLLTRKSERAGFNGVSSLTEYDDQGGVVAINSGSYDTTYVNTYDESEPFSSTALQRKIINLEQEIYPDSNLISSEKFTEGIPDSLASFSIEDKKITTAKYIYYPEEVVNDYSFIKVVLFNDQFDVVSESVEYSSNENATNSLKEYEYSYEFDENDNVTKREITSDEFDGVRTTTYKWEEVTVLDE